MARNGTVCQAGSSRMAARLSPTNPTQAMSTQDRWGHCRSRRDAGAASPGRVPPGGAPPDPGSADPDPASGRSAAGPPLAGPAWGEGAMAERAMGAARHLGGTRLVRRCVDTISPHLIRGRGHAALANAAARTSVTSGGLLRPPSSLSLQPMRVNAETGPRPGNPAPSDDLWLPQFAG